jgi:hypothetical protein
MNVLITGGAGLVGFPGALADPQPSTERERFAHVA